MARTIIGVDGSERSEDALAFGHMLAVSPGYVQLVDEMRDKARDALEQRVTHLTKSVPVEATFAEGDAADALIELSELVDLMVIGSRGYGPLQAVLLGGVSAR